MFCSDKNFMYVWLYAFLGCTRACFVDVVVMVMSSAWDMTWTGALGGGKSAVWMLNTVGERNAEWFSHTENYSNDRAGRANLLNPFATVLFNVCIAVTVECSVLYPVFGMFAVM